MRFSFSPRALAARFFGGWIPWLSIVTVILTMTITGFELVAIYMADGEPRMAHKFSGINYILDMYNMIQSGSTATSTMMNWAWQEAVLINFWLVLVDKGMTLSEFHHTWMASTGFKNAVIALYKKQAIWIACLAIIFTITNIAFGPLLHFTVVPDVAVVGFRGVTNLHITKSIMPAGVLASQIGNAISIAHYQRRENIPIQFPAKVCDNCTIEAPGFGWNAQCWYTNGDNYNITPEATQSVSTMFGVKINEHFDPSGYKIRVESLYKPAYGCTGNYIYEQCSLEPTVSLYKLRVNGNTTRYRRNETLLRSVYTEPDPAPKYSWYPATTIPGSPSDEVLAYPYRVLPGPRLLAGPTPIQSQTRPPMADGKGMKIFEKLGKDGYETYYGAVFKNFEWHMGEDNEKNGSGYRSYLALPYGEQQDQNGVPDPRNVRFHSPMLDILDMYVELAFRTSVIAAIGQNATRELEYCGERVELVDRIRSMWCFALCVVVGFFPPICIIIIELHVRKLPRSFSPSNLAIGNALLHQIKGEHETSLMEVLAACPHKNPTTSELVKYADEWDQKEGEGMKLRFGLIESADGRYGIDLAGLVTSLDEIKSGEEDDIEAEDEDEIKSNNEDEIENQDEADAEAEAEDED